MADLRTVQLTDNSENPVSPYTPAASVYYSYIENGRKKYVNMETKIGSMDIGRINAAQENALDAINEQREESLTKISDEGESYREDINTISGMTIVLDNKVCPLAVSTSITPNFTTMKATHHYIVTEYSTSAATGVNVELKYKANEEAEQVLYSGSLGEKTTTTNISYGKNVLTTSATKNAKTAKKTDTRYLCVSFAGSSMVNVSAITVGTKYYTTSASFTATVSTDNGQYIWLAVPNYLTISRVTSGGFDVTMNPYVSVTVNNVQYKAYRSSNPLQQQQWTLVIS